MDTFHEGLTEQEQADPRFAHRVAFVQKTANRARSADLAIEFVGPDSDEAAEINRVLIKETEKTKYRPMQIVAKMREEGYAPPWFYYAQFHYHFQRGEFEAAYAAVHRLNTAPGAYWHYIFGAAALVRLDRVGEAKALIERARKAEPNLDEATKPVPDLWWWALPDKGSGYVAALKKGRAGHLWRLIGRAAAIDSRISHSVAAMATVDSWRDGRSPR